MSMRSIYRKIAKQNGVSVNEVKEEMQKAIDVAWDNPNKTAENAFMQYQAKPDGTKPTPEELIRFNAELIKKKQ